MQTKFIESISKKIKKFKELSLDIEEKCLEVDIEKIDSDGISIESIIDVITEESIKENYIGVPTDLTSKPVKRGDVIYITAMIRKDGSSMTSPATQAVIKLRVVDIYNGLSYLNKVINNK